MSIMGCIFKRVDPRMESHIFGIWGVRKYVLLSKDSKWKDLRVKSGIVIIIFAQKYNWP